MIFQFEYAQRGSTVAVDHYAGTDPEALEFCGTTVYDESAFLALKDRLTEDGVFPDEIYFVDLDKS